MSLTSEEFLQRLKELKTFEAGQIKLNAQGLCSMVMCGACDSMFPSTPSIAERKEFIEKILKTIGSKISLKSKDPDDISIIDIETELDRKTWLAQRNPFYSFYLIDEYESALANMGLQKTGAPNLAWRSQTVDVFTNFRALYTPSVVSHFSSPYVTKRVGIVARFMGKETKRYDGGEFLKLKLIDGINEEQVTVWPRYGTLKYDPVISNFIAKTRRTGLFVGKISSSKGYTNFSIERIVELFT